MNHNYTADLTVDFDPESGVSRFQLRAILEKAWLQYLEANRPTDTVDLVDFRKQIDATIAQSAARQSDTIGSAKIRIGGEEMDQLKAEYDLSSLAQIERLQKPSEIIIQHPAEGQRPQLKASMEKLWADSLWAMAKDPTYVAKSMKELDRNVAAKMDAAGVGDDTRDEMMKIWSEERNKLYVEFVSDPEGQRKRLEVLGYAPPPPKRKGGNKLTSPQIVNGGAKLADLAMRTAVRATVWDAVGLVFRSFGRRR